MGNEYTFIESQKGNANLTIINAVSGIDGTGSLSGAVELATKGFADFLMELSILPTGTTDDLIWELFTSFDETVFSDVVTRTGVIANPGASTTIVHVDIPAFPWPKFKLLVKSAGGTDTWTVTAKIRRYRISEAHPRG